MKVPSVVRRVLNQPDSFDCKTSMDLEKFMASTISGENASKEKPAQCLSNSIFNTAVEFIAKPNRDRGAARYL